MDLYNQDGDGQFVKATLPEILAEAKNQLRQRVRLGARVDHPSCVHDYMLALLAGQEHETFGIVHLDNRHRVLKWEEMFRGTIDGAAVHPREVVKSVLKHNAAAVIFVHNHPSGVADASHKRQAHRLNTVRSRFGMLRLTYSYVAIEY